MDEVDIIASAAGNWRVGPYWDVVRAPSFVDEREPRIQLGLLDDSRRIAERTGTHVAQYIYIVRHGLVDAVLLYRGVKRRMKFGSDMHADEKILAYVWRPSWDFEWRGDRQSQRFPAKLRPPDGRVFVVLVRPYERPDEHVVSGSILRWSWVHGDLVEGPVDDADGTRYTKLVWGK